MWLTTLALVNFRNLAPLRLEPRPGVVLFCGRNGQGKTNLLEAIAVLATTRSPRTSVERELISWRLPSDPALAAVLNPFARLEARVRRRAGEVHLELSLEAERASAAEASAAQTGPVTRQIKVNGLPTRASGLIGQLPVVYFSPADVELAGGAPAGRRQYLNVATSQASPDHLRALQRYNRVLLQRNQTLRLVRERRQSAAALEPWTEQMIVWGTRILVARLTMIAWLNGRINSLFTDLAGSSESLRVSYRSTACDVTTLSATDAASPADLATRLADAFRDRQERLAAREIDQAVSLVGPHRDDFSLLLDDVDLTRYGSRGQQRLAVLALKLGEAEWMKDGIGERPIVLLDDVLSELDPQRRRFVLRQVAAAETNGQTQVWITTTEPGEYAAAAADGPGRLADVQRFEIDAGVVRTA